MKVAIMLPTYNEADNIENLIRNIHSVNQEFEIVAVDDDSPDGTGDILERLKDKNERIHVVHRKGERGRGSAGILGFRECLKLNPDVVIEMDADFSHDPEFIPHLLKRMSHADVVIASRYVDGGKDSRGVLRSSISRIANQYIKLVCGIDVYDATSGFRAFSADKLKDIVTDEFESSGPSIVQEVLLKLINNGVRIVEVPYQFSDRRAGKSKLSFFLLLRTLLTITKLAIKFRLKTLREKR
jgi:dolichol-phosphate mannosyltransferase